MRVKVAKTKNLQKLKDQIHNLLHRDPTTPGISVVDGATGNGKTTSAKHLAVQVDAVFVRAYAVMTPTSLLGAIMRELGAEPLHSAAEMVRWIADAMAAQKKALFVDEADYLVRNLRLVETLRDLHDLSTMPVVLIGMDEFKRHVGRRPQLAGRVSQWITFGAADRDDARSLADTVCEVSIADDLLERLMEVTSGSMRGLVVGLSRIEQYARTEGIASVDAATWGSRELVMRSGR